MEKFVDTDGCAIHGSHPHHHHHHHGEVTEKSTSRTTSTLYGRKSKPVSLDLNSPTRKDPKRYPESFNLEAMKQDTVKQDTNKQKVVKEDDSVLDNAGKNTNNFVIS